MAELYGAPTEQPSSPSSRLVRWMGAQPGRDQGRSAAAAGERRWFLRHKVLGAIGLLLLLVILGIVLAAGLSRLSSRSPAPAHAASATTAVPSPTSAPSASSAHSAPASASHRSLSVTAPSVRPLKEHSSVFWSDGLSFTLAKISAGTIAPHDTGGARGGDKTIFEIKLTNGRTRPYPLSGVAVSVTYGSQATRAAQVTNANVHHPRFSGTLAPHHSMTARYQFAIPAADRKDVTLTVRPADHDVRPAGVFAGSAP